jgi:hypothetical protein
MTIRTDLALASGNITTPLIRNTGRVAGGLFSTLGSWRDDDVLRYVAQLNPVLGGAKQQASRATVAFYQNIARLTGQPFNRPVIAASDLATKTLRNNITSETLFTRPFVDMRRALSSGSSMTTAIEAGARRANQLAQTEVQLAKRQVGYKVRQANQNIVGYVRTLTGSENCALCYVASTQRYHKGDLLPIHPGCDCGEMPLYGTDDPGQIINQQRLDATHEAVEARFGEFDRSAREIDYRNIMVADHGEMGPVLTWKKHNSVKLADLGKPTVAGEVVDSVIDQTPITTIMRRLKEEELTGLRVYTGESFMAMNAYLRTDRQLRTDVAGRVNTDVVDYVEGMEQAFEASRLNQNTTLYRGTGPQPFGLGDMPDDQLVERLKQLEGQTIVEKGFTSTTTDVSAAFDRRILMEIDAPEGLPALDVNGIDDLPYSGRRIGIRGESEVILQPGQKLQIKEVIPKRNTVLVKLEAVKDNE